MMFDLCDSAKLAATRRQWSRSQSSQRISFQTALKSGRACLDQDNSWAYHINSIVQQVSGVTYRCRFLWKHPKKLLPGLYDELRNPPIRHLPFWSIWMLPVISWQALPEHCCSACFAVWLTHAFTLWSFCLQIPFLALLARITPDQELAPLCLSKCCNKPVHLLPGHQLEAKTQYPYRLPRAPYVEQILLWIIWKVVVILPNSWEAHLNACHVKSR